MMQIHISPMAPSDLDQVLKIDPSFLKSELNQEAATLLVARDGKRIVGYIDFWEVLDEIHLINIAVHSDYRRKGVATQLLNVMCQGEGEGGRKIYLEVKVSNDGAKKFYEKKGFRVIGTRKRYYPDGEDAVVMIR